MKRVSCKSLIQLRYTRSTRMALGSWPITKAYSLTRLFKFFSAIEFLALLSQHFLLGCLSGSRPAGNTLFCKAHLKIICVCGAIGANQVQVQMKTLCRFILAVAKIQPSMVGEVDSVLSFSVSTPGPAYFGVICSLIKGKRGETIRQSDGLLLLCVSLTGPLSEASSPSVVVCPMSLYSVRSTRTKCLIVISDSPCSRRISTNNTRTSCCLCLLTTLYGLPALQFYFLLVLLFLALSSPCHALLPFPCTLYGARVLT